MGFAEKSLLTALKTHLRTAQESRDLATDDESRAAVDASIASLTQQIAVLEGGGSLTDLAKVTASFGDDEEAVTAASGEPDHVEADTAGPVVVGGPNQSSSFGGVFSGTFTRKSIIIGAAITVAVVGLFLILRLFGGDFWNGGCSTWSPDTGWQTYDADDPFCDGD